VSGVINFHLINFPPQFVQRSPSRARDGGGEIIEAVPDGFDGGRLVMGSIAIKQTLSFGFTAFIEIGSRGGWLCGFFVGGDGESLVVEFIVAHIGL
jgi:hypothetical protein